MTMMTMMIKKQKSNNNDDGKRKIKKKLARDDFTPHSPIREKEGRSGKFRDRSDGMRLQKKNRKYKKIKKRRNAKQRRAGIEYIYLNSRRSDKEHL